MSLVGCVEEAKVPKSLEQISTKDTAAKLWSRVWQDLYQSNQCFQQLHCHFQCHVLYCDCVCACVDCGCVLLPPNLLHSLTLNSFKRNRKTQKTFQPFKLPLYNISILESVIAASKTIPVFFAKASSHSSSPPRDHVRAFRRSLISLRTRVVRTVNHFTSERLDAMTCG